MTMITSLSVLIAILGAFLALFFTWRVRNLALRKGWTFAPDSHRHVHCNPIPRLGGVGIFLAFVTILTLLSVFPLGSIGFEVSKIAGIIFASSVVFVIGLYDDMRGLGATAKFIAQGICGVLLYAYGYRLEFFADAGVVGSAIAFVVSVLWVAAISNAFNLVDGLDGLAAGTGFLSCATIFVVALWTREFSIALLAAALGGALIGFLRFNSHPATIFMGDSGSLFVGCLLAGLSLSLTRSLPSGFAAITVPIMCCALPLFETSLSIARRLAAGKPPFHADREHIHHRLLDRGFGQQEVVWMLHMLSGVCAVSALMLLSDSVVLRAVAIGVPSGAFASVVVRLGYHRLFSSRALFVQEHSSLLASSHGLKRLTRDLRKASDLKRLTDVLEGVLERSDFDGFELLVIPGSRAPNGAKDTSGNLYTWDRFKRRRRSNDRWNLSVELGTKRHPTLGYFVLYREYSRGAIEEDLDQVLDRVRETLSRNIERITDSTRKELSHERAILSADDQTQAVILSQERS